MKLEFSILPENYAICRLHADSAIPSWAYLSDFFSITRSRDELSLVVVEDYVPEDETIKTEPGWQCLKVAGPLDFSLVGILAEITNILARQKISLFAVSTFDTDYILVKEKDFEPTISALQKEGHRIK